MFDVNIRVTATRCEFLFVSPAAQHFGVANFDDACRAETTIWQARNVIQALEAEGLVLAPPSLLELEASLVRYRHLWRMSLQQPAENAERERRATLIERVLQSLRPELTVLEWMSVVLLAVLLSGRIWMAAEPLLFENGVCGAVPHERRIASRRTRRNRHLSHWGRV